MASAIEGDDKIKIERIDPFGHMTLTEAELVAQAMNEGFIYMPVRRVTLEEAKALYPDAAVIERGAE